MSVFKKLKDGIADLSELSVNTFTGDLKAHIDDASGSSIIKWDELLKSAKTEGDISLVAAARYKFDGDSDSFYMRNAPADLLAAHKQAVEAGQKVREGLINMFGDLIGITVKK
ncbi:MAG: hypothetical protein ACYTAS_14140 [Planctomycetota bacterium]